MNVLDALLLKQLKQLPHVFVRRFAMIGSRPLGLLYCGACKISRRGRLCVPAGPHLRPAFRVGKLACLRMTVIHWLGERSELDVVRDEICAPSARTF